MFVLPKLHLPLPVINSFLPSLSFFSIKATFKFGFLYFNVSAKKHPDAPAPTIITSYIKNHLMYLIYQKRLAFASVYGILKRAYMFFMLKIGYF